ncbi:hypothetical protein [Caudoviricetes sp.]|nr:hypothetical protein [Caudoviricetes sp.]
MSSSRAREHWEETPAVGNTYNNDEAVKLRQKNRAIRIYPSRYP